MVKRINRTIAFIGLACFVITQSAVGQRNLSTSYKAMVSTVRPEATDAAVRVLQQGGNAVDAAITAAFTLSVVDGYNSGIGGGCFILIRTPDGKLLAIDGREMAPRAAKPDMYLRDGRPIPGASEVGPLASGVPGAVAAYEMAWQIAGRKPWSDLLGDAITYAVEGFTIPEKYAERIRSKSRLLSQFSGSREVLFDSDDEPRKAGTKLVQTDLGKTLAGIQAFGSKYFYRGPPAVLISRWMEHNGGILALRDFRRYRPISRTPVISTFRGYTVVGFPPPSSGGVHVAQMLNILEQYDLKTIYGQNPNDFRHVVIESMKLAFADRAYWLGDPKYAKVPLGLVSKEYARKLSAKIDLNKANTVLSHGTPALDDTKIFDRHTTHITAVDAEGFWVAITATVNTSFGSKVIVPGTGVVLNNEMDDFSIAPGVPNAFGLIGSEANEVVAFKRPLSSMSPTIILKDGQPVMTLGAAGGPRIITNALLGAIRVLDLGMSPEEAIGEKRFHHQWSPNKVYLESGTDGMIAESLRKRGHTVLIGGSTGTTQMIYRDPSTGLLTGVHDPRVPGKADGPREHASQ
ncbi:MAG: gamma-glutamyltransferase [Planctomycetaceae bacterium]|nr:gamma-glutamyltransferase [Planctomycetaceae bacterium]MBT4844732.1 gamma-glutamyltransferase [Planctomycetaceae bacterium]MBT5124934.1 gamma-glutamyltransferase [Planctomycetaceae bacterium]MBT5599098.1 gamma-glutamyltransferase [Planctomycetaceae bacterium]MBT5883655.1 gamma-glutamyltransferase [Planctomycetaceae bacterium]